MIISFYRTTIDLVDKQSATKYYNENILVSGKIRDDPKEESSNITFILTEINIDNEKINGNIYVSTNNSCKLSRDDLVIVGGVLVNGFGSYIGTMPYATIKNISRPQPRNFILEARDWLADRIKMTINEPESSLGISYLLGMKNELSGNLANSLRIVGLTHIVVASGTHLSILVDIARKLFKKVSRFAELFFSVLFVLFFIVMIGGTASILRAGIMSIMSLLAWYVGRKFAPWRIIIITATITLLLNPMFITDLGWLLSFASFIGIMVLYPRITYFFYGTDTPGFISSIIIATISATLMTLPITIYYYGTFSIISILANLIILPTLPYAMGLTFFSGVLVYCPFLAFLASKMLRFHIIIIDFFSRQSYFVIELPKYNAWFFLAYLPIAAMLAIGHYKRKVVKLRKYNIR